MNTFLFYVNIKKKIYHVIIINIIKQFTAPKLLTFIIFTFVYNFGICIKILCYPYTINTIILEKNTIQGDT